jgi:hypothetical protein
MIAASEEMTMARRPRQNRSPALKAKAPVAAIKGEKTLIALAQDFDVHLLPAGHVCMPERQTKSSNGAISSWKAPLGFLVRRQNPRWSLRST